MVALVAATFSNLIAQTANSYLMLNFGANRFPNQLGNGFTGTPIGFQWITAYRIDLNYSFTSFQKYHQSHESNDTFYSTRNHYEFSMPKFSLGKEWRKQIHKDISIYAGSDFSFGLGTTRSSTYEIKILKTV